jgi:hypothetical protein
MKKIILVIAVIIAAVAAQAQTVVEDKVIGGETIRYVTEHLSSVELTALLAFVHVDVTLYDGEEGAVEISYPLAERPYINFGIENYEGKKALIIGRNGYVDIPKKTLLSDKVPIYVRVSASQLKTISGHGDTMLRIERDKFANDLTLKNGFVMSIVTKSITALNSLTIHNAGTMTCHVKEWNTANIKVSSSGYLYMHGATTAKQITYSCAKESISDVRLDVDCEGLYVLSRGKGVLRYRGKADDVQVSSRGKRCTIYTSELNAE